MLTQPMMRRLFLNNQTQISRKAEQIAWEIHRALCESDDDGEYTTSLIIPRGELQDWRSYNDAITYNGVQSREEYHRLWEENFPQEAMMYILTSTVKEGRVSLTISDGYTKVLLSESSGAFMIPQVLDTLQGILQMVQQQPGFISKNGAEKGFLKNGFSSDEDFLVCPKKVS